MQPGWGSLLWFAAIVAMIPLALWLLKRTPMGGAGSGPAGSPRTVAVLALSPQQRVVTVEVGQGGERRWLVLGVSAQGIQALHSLPAQGEAAAVPPPAKPFAQLMSRLGGSPGTGAGSGDAR
jgi:flagellar protein FliO/FliZ